MDLDFTSNLASRVASINKIIDSHQEAIREQERVKLQSSVDTANAAMATAEELRALHEAIQHESLKRDKADKRNLVLSISGLVLMAATLVAALVSLFGK